MFALSTPPGGGGEDDTDDGGGRPSPLDLFRRTAARFARENRRRRQLAAVRDEKAQARAIAEQAKDVVLAAKRGRRDDGRCDDADDDADACRERAIADGRAVRQSAGRDTSEYAELERLGLGKCDGAGRWVPNTNNMLRDKLLRFQ